MGEANATKKTGFFKGLKGEFKKITWPNFSVLMKQTWTVIFVSLVIGAFIALIDFCYSSGIFYILGK